MTINYKVIKNYLSKLFLLLSNPDLKSTQKSRDGVPIVVLGSLVPALIKRVSRENGDFVVPFLSQLRFSLRAWTSNIGSRELGVKSKYQQLKKLGHIMTWQ